MPSYIPEHVYGFTGWDKHGQATHGMVPWPKHLQPRTVDRAMAAIASIEAGRIASAPSGLSLSHDSTHVAPAAAPDASSGIELTKKGEAYAERALAEAGGVFFLTLDRSDRVSIATTIERLIDMLDAMEQDPDLEAGGDDEPSLGWCGHSERQYGVRDGRELDTSDDEDGGDLEPTLGTNEMRNGESQERWALTAYGTDEVEDENEHGGDINDEPHDAEEDDDRDGLAGIGDVLATSSDGRGGGWSGRSYDHLLAFDGEGGIAAYRALRTLRTRRPDVRQDYVGLPHVDGDANALEVGGLLIRGKGRPRNPAHSPDLYPNRFCMITDGICCEPEIMDGAHVIVDRTKPVLKGDFVVIWRHPSTVPPGGHAMLVKRLVAVYPSALIAETLNPPARLFFDKDKVLAVWYCEAAPVEFVPGRKLSEGQMLAGRVRMAGSPT